MRNTRIMRISVFFSVAIFLLPQLAQAKTIKVHVVVQDAKVRFEPEISSPEIARLSLGSILEAEEGPEGWYRVTLPPDENGFVVIGYFQKKDSDLVSATASEKKKLALLLKPVATRQGVPISQVSQRQRKSGGMEIGLKFFGGGAMFFGKNHINDFWGAYADYFDDYWKWWYFGADHVNIDRDLGALKSGFLGGVELFFNINPYFGFGLGGGYLSARKENTLSFSDTWADDGWDETHMQKVSAPYLTFNIYGGLPIGNMLRIMPYLGAGLYLGTLSLHSCYSYLSNISGYTNDLEESWSAKSNTLGFQGGVNFEFFFTRKIGVFVGLEGLLATFKELVGNASWNESDSDGWSDSGTISSQLWFYEEVGFSTSDWYPRIMISADKPSENSWIRNVEPVIFSISQFRFVIGFVFFFMR